MARVTAEDCVVKIPNRFELVMMASQRAREIGGGMTLTIDRDNDKNPVVALREIAEETVVLDELRESLVRGHQKVIPSDEHEDEIIDLMEGEQGWVRPDGELQTLADEGMIDQDDEGADWTAYYREAVAARQPGIGQTVWTVSGNYKRWMEFVICPLSTDGRLIDRCIAVEDYEHLSMAEIDRLPPVSRE